MRLFLFFLFSSSFLTLSADWTAFATDQSNFQIITYDIQTATAGPSISAGRSQEIAITPDATRLYVINRNVTSSVSVIDVATQTVINTINLNVGIDQLPFSIAITPDGTTAYITSLDTNGDANVLKLDLTTNLYTVTQLIPNIQASGIAISNDGAFIYMTQTSTVLKMATATNIFSLPLFVPGRSTRIALDPSNTFAYVTDRVNNNLYQIDLTAFNSSNIIPLTAGSQPTNLAISSDGNWIYIANENANFATSVDIANSLTTADVILGSLPTNYSQLGVAITPDSKTAVFGNSGANQISTIEVGTTNVTNTAVSGFPDFIAITPDQAPTASFTSVIQNALLPSTFTSTSTTPTGTIASYFWDFGDGNTLTTTLNPVQHTYLTGGNYTVSLTVTNSAGTSTAQIFTGQTVSNQGSPSATLSDSITVPNATAIILPPINGLAVQKGDKFANLTEYYNTVSWDAPQSGPLPLLYKVYSNASLTDLIANVTTGTSVTFHNQIKNKNKTYYVVSIGTDGERSEALVIELIFFHCCSN